MVAPEKYIEENPYVGSQLFIYKSLTYFLTFSAVAFFLRFLETWQFSVNLRRK